MSTTVPGHGLPRTSAAAAGASLLALVLTACGEENTYVAPPPPAVTVTEPVQKDVTDYVELTGSTQSTNTVDLVARVPGYLESVNFKDGAFVKKGDLLFVIERDTYEANVQLAKATVEQQQATLTQASSELARQQRLISQNATSQSALESAQAQQGAAQASVGEAQANLELAQINLRYTRVTAPFDGRMGEHLVDPGNLVGQGQPTELATIEQLAPMYVYVNMDEQEVLRIRTAMRAAGKTLADLGPIELEIGLQNETGYPHKATLDFVSSDLDTSTGTLTVRGLIPNKDYVFLPGQFVRVRVPVGATKDALLVPDAALGMDQRGHYLLLVGQDDVVEQRPVQIGALYGEMRVIANGLKADDRVVVNGLQRAIPNSKVAPTTAEQTPQAPAAPAAAANTDSPPKGQQ